MKGTAYLVVFCDAETNTMKGADVWSSPEWEQSRCLKDRVFVAYSVTGADFESARAGLLRAIRDPRCRYHYLCAYLGPEHAGDGEQ